MNRRSFLGALVATASGLLLPEPRRVYSFASELRVPGVEEYVPGWHRLAIAWNGTKTIAKVDDRAILDSPSPPENGIFFEYDQSVSGNWRAKHGESPMLVDEKTVLMVERGNAMVDYWHRTKIQTPPDLATSTVTIETLVRFAEPNARIRLSWG